MERTTAMGVPLRESSARMRELWTPAMMEMTVRRAGPSVGAMSSARALKDCGFTARRSWGAEEEGK